MLGWMKHKLESSLPGEISVTSDVQMTPFMAESEEELKSLLMRMKIWLKIHHSKNENHGIQSHHFMANRWGKSGNSDRLYFGKAPKSLQMVTAAMKLKDTCSLEGKL